MCPPTFFEVSYSINPWMQVHVPVDLDRVQRQWDGLRATYEELGHEVQIVEPAAGLPDMGFCASLATLDTMFPDAIVVAEEDACAFGLNAMSDGYNVVLSHVATGLRAQLRAAGFNPVGVDISELLKAGGGAKCCTLELHA